MPSKFQKPKGMRDLLEDDLKYFKRIKKAASSFAGFYKFREIETPILEDRDLFEKGTGESTEIVCKQMFNLRTKSGRRLTLRPEATPAIVRSYLEEGMESWRKPVKLWHFGPYFRYENPQTGRYRQFYQAGFEAIGSKSWIIDAEIIQIFHGILSGLGFKNLIVEINSIGDFKRRAYYKKKLANYLNKYKNSLCPDCKRRIKENPLRVLDCKEEKCAEIVRRGAPQMMDNLSKKATTHFKNLLETLEELKIPYRLNPYLVRGLDYYNRTVFEMVEEKEGEEKSKALGGGGRYDGLVSLLGGKYTPACGGALGVDRIAELMKSSLGENKKFHYPKVFIAQVGKLPKRKALKLIEEFRGANIKVGESLHKGSLSSQLNLANQMGARYVIILAYQETVDGQAILRNMEDGSQRKYSIDKIVGEVTGRVRRMKKQQ